ncbi:T9SS type B sorting domain-containing protein [Winogradskyella alexanderae]|uniref:Gliding motility-associated C-terminal domain-containing protein n=1 Tax=Winogradskyella alexanderae TaxID=2877123 RepID=A0ABS7XTL1_9FLAO|nr:gliding motility-associated C-terminal domain-containing protein [Winogradskyella alexanderae]MCA0132729.1 gliding motility-associated C-terminal domain-containing protein [Winogradskyella alexanderae]
MLTLSTLNKLILSLCLFLICFIEHAEAQVVLGTPNLGFTQACANASFNTYNLSFVFSPESALESTNQFSIEMSNADGDFSEAIIIYTSQPGEFITSPATLEFSLPETTAGENYRLRVKSSAPAANSSGSVNFAAYYKLQDSPFTINNLVSTGAYCTGGSYLLTIDNPGTGNNDSPLNYPSLTFNWFRETSPTTSEFISEGPTLSVSTEGTYFVETNYGSCTSNSFSNRVTITEATSGEADATIASSLGNPFCPEQGNTTLSTIGGISYQWFKNGEIIPEATNQQYQTNESGTFSVQVDLGDCSASGSIELVSELFNSTINVDEVNSIEEGETLIVNVSTDAISPVFEWYFNNQLIPNETTDTIEASDFGDYKVTITETSGCNSSKTYEFTVEEALDPFPDVDNIPNVISPNGDGINDTWVLPLQYVSGTNTTVMIMSNRGDVVFQTDDYQNNWPQTNLNTNSINQVFYYIITTENNITKKGTITVVK